MFNTRRYFSRILSAAFIQEPSHGCLANPVWGGEIFRVLAATAAARVWWPPAAILHESGPYFGFVVVVPE